MEREDLHEFIVKRGAGAASSGSTSLGGSARNSAKRPLFRCRPLQQFHNWVGRTRVSDIPPDERATVQPQLTEIKEALEKQLAELQQLQGTAPGDAPGNEVTEVA